MGRDSSRPVIREARDAPAVHVEWFISSPLSKRTLVSSSFPNPRGMPEDNVAIVEL